MSGDVLDEELDPWDDGQVTIGEGARHAVRWLEPSRLSATCDSMPAIWIFSRMMGRVP
jgi:hypothetical protein